MRTGRAISVSTIIITVLLATATSRPASAQSQKSRATHDDPFQRVGINRVQQSAPDFNLRDVQGNSVSLSSLGGRVVFLNFWATWCAPCRQEMPSMERLYRQFRGRGLAMLAVNQKESRQQVAGFMREYGLTFPALLDPDGRVFSQYRVWAIPRTYLIDGTGRIVGARAGSLDWASREVVDLFQNMIGGESRPGGETTASFAFEPPTPFPTVIVAKSSGGTVHVQQDRRSPVVATLEKGETLRPLAKVLAGGGEWYMVKSKSGAMGWVPSSEVEEPPKTK